MRKQFCDAMVARASTQDAMVFLTGDLGFMALEPLQQALGQRFVNAGVSEQNMVSVAAAMAREGLEPWVYSIAPFCYARPFEQIRNDITFHGLTVRLVGNGGGYGYGVMGPTHHAIEDYGVMLSLPNMRVYAPVFDEDVTEVIPRVGAAAFAAYIRLGRGEPPKGYAVPRYAPWRQLIAGRGSTVIAVGALGSAYIEALLALEEELRPNLWVVAELPLEANPLPPRLLNEIEATSCLLVAEEHVARGSFGSELALHLLSRGILPRRFVHLHALAHRYERYGSQAYLRKQSRLDAASLISAVNS